MSNLQFNHELVDPNDAIDILDALDSLMDEVESWWAHTKETQRLTYDLFKLIHDLENHEDQFLPVWFKNYCLRLLWEIDNKKGKLGYDKLNEFLWEFCSLCIAYHTNLANMRFLEKVDSHYKEIKKAYKKYLQPYRFKDKLIEVTWKRSAIVEIDDRIDRKIYDDVLRAVAVFQENFEEMESMAKKYTVPWSHMHPNSVIEYLGSYISFHYVEALKLRLMSDRRIIIADQIKKRINDFLVVISTNKRLVKFNDEVLSMKWI